MTGPTSSTKRTRRPKRRDSGAELYGCRLAADMMGLTKDDRIVLQVPNVVEYFIIRSALRKAGLPE